MNINKGKVSERKSMQLDNIDMYIDKHGLFDVVVVGGGPAGLGAALEAKRNGALKVVIIERDIELGGILQQCIHNGFGIHVFNEELTGPEYANRYVNMVKETDIRIFLDTMAISVSWDSTDSSLYDKTVIAMSTDGIITIKAKAIVLAMGCRERSRGSIGIPGDRPSGIFTAGVAQRYMNIEGYMVGKKVIIQGAGDIGMIMARRIVLEGGEVVAVLNRGDIVKGLTRNIVQCLEHYNIPLLLNHNIIRINGKERVESVTVAQTDKKKKPIAGTEKVYECDTVLLSVGLIPENELSKMAGVEIDRKTSGPIVNDGMETSIPGVFACGNVVHVHDVVDFVTEESKKAGASAARYVLQLDEIFTDNKSSDDNQNTQADALCSKDINIIASNGISYTVPQKVRYDLMLEKIDLFMRVEKIYDKARIVIKQNDKELVRFNKVNLMPGEMIILKVKKSIFEGITGDVEVCLEVAE